MSVNVINAARNLTGRSWVTIAGHDDLRVTYQTVYAWQTGKTKVPAHKWSALSRAIGLQADMSREQYLKEYAALNAAPAPPPPVNPAPATVEPAPPPKGSWFSTTFGGEVYADE